MITELSARQTPLTMTVGEAAQALGISETTLRIAVRQGKVPVVRIGRRVLVARRVLEDITAGVRTIEGPIDTRNAG